LLALLGCVELPAAMSRLIAGEVRGKIAITI